MFARETEKTRECQASVRVEERRCRRAAPRTRAPARCATAEKQLSWGWRRTAAGSPGCVRRGQRAGAAVRGRAARGRLVAAKRGGLRRVLGWSKGLGMVARCGKRSGMRRRRTASRSFTRAAQLQSEGRRRPTTSPHDRARPAKRCMCWEGWDGVENVVQTTADRQAVAQTRSPDGPATATSKRAPRILPTTLQPVQARSWPAPLYVCRLQPQPSPPPPQHRRRAALPASRRAIPWASVTRTRSTLLELRAPCATRGLSRQRPRQLRQPRRQSGIGLFASSGRHGRCA